MAVGPIMQGFVLMGIIYWYSKGMISMINDYYRNEFQRKLHHPNDTTLHEPNYDVEKFDDLLNVESFLEKIEILDKTSVEEKFQTEERYKKEEEFCKNLPKNLDQFMDLIRLNSKEMESICLDSGAK